MGDWRSLRSTLSHLAPIRDRGIAGHLVLAIEERDVPGYAAAFRGYRQFHGKRSLSLGRNFGDSLFKKLNPADCSRGLVNCHRNSCKTGREAED